MTKKVLVSDNLSASGIEILERAEGIEVDVKTGLKPDELEKIIGEYHGLAIRSGTKVTARLIEAAKNLQVVGRAGSGVDNVDLDAASRRGIVVMNTPGGNTVTTAEHTISMMMAVSRNIPQATASLKAGKWEKKKFQGRELFNKTLGVIGLGNIGAVVADRARGLKMKVIGYDPFLSKEAARRMEVELVDLDNLFARADYVTVHVPATAETRGIVDAAALEKMKPGAFVINCARGGIVDEKALAQALESGRIGGAAFDVFEKEPPPPDHPLLAQERFICTPHLGASTDEAQENVAVAVAEQIVDYLQHDVVRNAVNVPSVSQEVLEAVGPFLDLATRLGSLVGQLGPANATEIKVITAGEVNRYPVKPVALAALKGMLGRQLDVPVNEVNAGHLAGDRGLELVEQSAASTTDFASLVTLEVKGPDESLAVSGTIFGKKEPRIVRLGRFDLEAVPDGQILAIQNKDRPGVIGHIGSVLGDAGINIARMQLSLDRERGEALALVNVDTAPDESALEKLRAIPHMIRVDLIEI